MKLREAFKRLHFTLSKQNKPNDTDIEAFNVIADIFEKSEKATIEDNQHFAKLYALMLSHLTERYTDIDEANKELNRILQAPIIEHIHVLKISLQYMEMRNFFNRNGIKDSYLKKLSADELKVQAERYKHLSAEDFANSWDNWDHDTVTSHLNTNINLSLTCLKK